MSVILLLLRARKRELSDFGYQFALLQKANCEPSSTTLAGNPAIAVIELEAILLGSEGIQCNYGGSSLTNACLNWIGTRDYWVALNFTWGA
jgi:hypothetical protein